MLATTTTYYVRRIRIYTPKIIYNYNIYIYIIPV
jgi:hypothetical protein